MDMKITALAVVAILAIGGAGAVVVLNGSGSSDDGDKITFVDGSMSKIVLDKPLTNVAVLNSNVPKAMQMLDIDDAISCYYYGTNTFGIRAEELAKTQTDRNLGSYYTPSPETMLKYGVQAVICPVSSMTMYASVQKTCEQNGIVVIRLDCNGDTLFDDLNKLSMAFGEPESAKSVLDKYVSERNAMVQAIESSLSSTNLLDYLAIFDSKEAIYNSESSVADLLSSIFNDNVTSYTDLPTDTVTNPINDGSKEVIAEKMADVDVLIIRAQSKDFEPSKDSEATADNYFNEYVGANKLVTFDSPAYTNGKVLVIDSDLMSGLYAHIGLLILVNEIYDISVAGYEDISSVITAFNEAFNQSVIVDGQNLLFAYGADAGPELENVAFTYVASA